MIFFITLYIIPMILVLLPIPVCFMNRRFANKYGITDYGEFIEAILIALCPFYNLAFAVGIIIITGQGIIKMAGNKRIHK